MISSSGKKKKGESGFLRLVSNLFLLLILAGLLLGAIERWKPDLIEYKVLWSTMTSKADVIQSTMTSKGDELIRKVRQRPAVVEGGEILTCSGVTLDVNNNPLAMLDDVTVSIGDTHRGIKVIDITSGYVLVDIHGKLERLTVGGSLTFKTP